MVRTFILVITVSLLAGSVPAFAQKKDCNAYCAGTICGMSTNKNYCMNKCMQKCR